VCAVKAFDPRFIADTLNPLVVTGYGIATSSSLVLPTIGRREGLSRSTVCNLVRIDAMPFEIKEQIRKHPKLIKLGHAKVLAGLDGRQQQSLLTQIIQSGLSVHETEKRAKNEKPVVAIEKDPDTIKVENRLTEILGCTTTINLEQGMLEHLGYEEF